MMKGEVIGITKKPGYGYQFLTAFFLLIAVSVFFYSVANGEIRGFVGSIILTVITISAVQYEGVVIDCGEMLYQPYQTYLGTRVGKWETLPPITNVLVYAYHKRIVRQSRTWSPTVQQQTIYKVSIFDTQTGFELMVGKTNEEEEAFELARQLALHFEVELETDIRI
jgi:hypothetical protein